MVNFRKSARGWNWRVELWARWFMLADRLPAKWYQRLPKGLR